MTTITQLPTARPAATVLVVSTAAFLASLDLFIVNIAFPEIRQAFGTADLGAMSWVLNAYTLVFAAFMNPAGRLGDRYGHRRVFLTGLVVFTLGSATCGLSASFPMLVASRAVQALGAAMLMPSSLALLLAAVPAVPARRCRQHLVGGGCHGRCPRAAGWRPVGPVVLALDLFRQRPGRTAGGCRRKHGAVEGRRNRYRRSRSVWRIELGGRRRRTGVGADRAAGGRS